jgi:hypothetical protein
MNIMKKLNIVALNHEALEQTGIGASIAHCPAAAYNACI